MRDERMDQIHSEINRLTSLKRQLRAREKSIDGRNQSLQQPSQMQFGNIAQLKSDMKCWLPDYLMPCNIGGINEVQWQFLFQIYFDMTPVLATLSQNSVIRGSFQIDQEAAFLLTAISRSHDTDTSGNSATSQAPISVSSIVDRSSARTFNTGSMPIQNIGYNSNPSVLPTSMFLFPNGFVDITLNGLPPPTAPQNWSAEGAPTWALSFYGYRIRIADQSKVLSTIFGQY